MLPSTILRSMINIRDPVAVLETTPRRAQKRTIQRAKDFQCPPELQQGLADLEQAFSNGAYIWPWQSKLLIGRALKMGCTTTIG